jgi:hypothetical protein
VEEERRMPMKQGGITEAFDGGTGRDKCYMRQPEISVCCKNITLCMYKESESGTAPVQA